MSPKGSQINLDKAMRWGGGVKEQKKEGKEN